MAKKAFALIPNSAVRQYFLYAVAFLMQAASFSAVASVLRMIFTVFGSCTTSSQVCAMDLNLRAALENRGNVFVSSDKQGEPSFSQELENFEEETHGKDCL
jgi:hypothetical protein